MSAIDCKNRDSLNLTVHIYRVINITGVLWWSEDGWQPETSAKNEHHA